MDTRARHAPLGKNLTGVKDRACRRGYCIGGPDYAPEPLWPTMSKLLSQEAVRTGIMVAMRLEGPILCPFFACCDGVVVFSADGAIETFPAGQAYGARAIYDVIRSEEHTSELQSLMRNSYAVFCLKKKTQHRQIQRT